ncbi:MAG: hypothetical protein ABI644_11585 [Arenimonas sp.]
MADISARQYGINIGQALRDLPLEIPMQSAWPLVSEHIPKKKPRRYFPTALAAGLALLAIIPLTLNSPSGVVTPTESNLESVMQQSSQLENILLATRNTTASNASAEVISLALEDRIHAIDSELGSGTLSQTQQLGLWQQRVSILQEATGLSSSQRYRQAEGRPYEIAMVESF